MTTMSPEEYDWHVKLVQERYQRYKLSYKQAEKVREFESPKFISIQKHNFSTWEEWEYEWYAFKKILTQKQFALYKKVHETRVRNLEKHYKKGDADYLNQIEYHQAILDYSRKNFWPVLYSDALFFSFKTEHWHKQEITYLKAVYKEYLQNLRIELLSQHFREYRQTKPNHLKFKMLWFESIHLWPDYLSFEHGLTEPAKTVANYLVQQKLRFPDQTEKLIAKKIAEKQKFTETLNKKYFKDNGGWTATIGENWDEGEKRKHIIMPLLLADKDEYGWKSPIEW